MSYHLQISRKVEYGARAMIYLAALPDKMIVSFRVIARKMGIPHEFLAKIFKTLVKAGLVRSIRGAHGGYALARAPSTITFLEVVEALEGKVTLNRCTAPEGCAYSSVCTMLRVWQEGQERMLEVYRGVSIDSLAMRSLVHQSPVEELTAANRQSTVPPVRAKPRPSRTKRVARSA